jgi:nucleoside-diphosphate-sugar epimerase
VSRWLITGGAGFIGANLATHLLERGDDVVIIDDLSRAGSELNAQFL